MEFKTIGEILGQKYYAIPDYQRDYEWTNTENLTMLDDVMELLFSKDEKHFFGAIVTVPYDVSTGNSKSIDLDDYKISEANVRHLVDGQQRLTSFSILCSVLRELINEEESIDKEDKDRFFNNKLNNIIVGDKYKNKKPAPRLILNGDTGKCFNCNILKIVTDNPKMIYKGPKRLVQAQKTFNNGITGYRDRFLSDGSVKNVEEFYTLLIEAITEKIIFVDIKCDGAANAFQVFDSLNGKGLDLTAADRIKNIFISWKSNGKGAQNWNKLVELVGEEYLVNFFVSEFFFIKERRVSKNKLPDEFKEAYRDDARSDFDTFFSILESDGEYYGKLRSAKTDDKNLNEILLDFDAIGQDQAYVLLFAAYKQFGINKSEFYNFAKELFNLTARMQVCEKSTNRLDTIFSNCITKMKSGTATLPLITKQICEEKEKNISINEFKEAFARFCVKDNSVSEVYLRKIENYLRSQMLDRTPVERGLTVEHIIPVEYDFTSWYKGAMVPEEVEANFLEEYVQNIGNKLLLYGDDNSSASNEDYDYKKDIYRNGKRGQNNGTPIGTFLMVEELVNEYPETFEHKEVLDRARKLSEIAINIW